MAKVYTHPHWETFVIDRSIYTPLERETLPLFRPIFFMRAAQGPAGIPTFCYTSNEAKKIFGDATFDPTTEYFSREALYLNNLFTRQGAFIVRLISDAAQYASLVLEVRVKNIEVTQYQVDDSGNFIVDEETGEKIPEVDDNGAAVKEPGVELKWTIRPMNLTGDHPETLTNIKPTTYSAADGGYTIYPILAVKATSAGKALNNVGVKFFSNFDIVDDTLCEKTGSMQYQFGAVRKAYDADTVEPIYSDVGNDIESFLSKPDQVDTRVDANVSFDAVIANRYEDLLPFETHLYTDNIKTIGEAVCEVETDDATIFENFGEDDVTALPYLVNVTDYLNINGNPYTHVVVSDEEDGIVLNSERILYLQGGADGDIDDATIESLTSQYLKAVIYPEIVDQARYPFTHIIDTGVSLPCKKAFIQFLGVNDACKVILSTQDANIN